MQKTVKQHYVPQFYMRSFSKCKSSPVISFYSFKDKVTRDSVPVKSICYQDYFYGEDQIIEKYLSAKESNWANALSNINTNNYNNSDIDLAREFAMFQLQRTKAMFDYIQKKVSELVSELYSKEYNTPLDENLMKSISSAIQINPQLHIDIAKDLVTCISDLQLAIINNNTSHPFIISDAPVISTNCFDTHNSGPANIGVVIFFPIASDKLLMFYDSKFYSNIPTSISDKDVQAINKYQYISAEEKIMWTPGFQFIEDYTNNTELNLKRTVHFNNQKTNTLEDGNGEIKHLKSRALPYYYEISFLKLPLQIKKIDPEFRHTYPRVYDATTRKTIISQIYCSPGDNKNSPVKIKQLQEGLKHLLQYLDYYWETPKGDQIITGADMQIFKKATLEFLMKK